MYQSDLEWIHISQFVQLTVLWLPIDRSLDYPLGTISCNNLFFWRGRIPQLSDMYFAGRSYNILHSWFVCDLTRMLSLIGWKWMDGWTDREMDTKKTWKPEESKHHIYICTACTDGTNPFTTSNATWEFLRMDATHNWRKVHREWFGKWHEWLYMADE